MDTKEQNREQARRMLEEQYGQLWDIEQLNQDFVVIGYDAPCVIVRRRSDNAIGSLLFWQSPRLYYSFDIHEQKG